MGEKKGSIVAITQSQTSVYDEIDFKRMVQSALQTLEANGVPIPAGGTVFMMGFNAEDLHFDEHRKEGPYFVIGDCTPERYRQDPRTIYIEGCCPGPAIPETILKNCGITESEAAK
ncbi:MAG: hypothetical protein JSW39_18915 [Desulfobacterales bacterium]|nr:MAG: hypothetical protein JSW39_18915 [Desulfobacterales bacterium]